MKSALFACLLATFGTVLAEPAPRVIHAADFGATADTGEDAGPAVRAALEAVTKLNGEAVVLRFAPGRYDFLEKSMPKEFYAVSASIPLKKKPNRLLTIGWWLKGLNHLTIDGSGALFMFHGRVTPFVMDGCEDIELRNFRTDFARPPTMSEFRIDGITNDLAEVTIHPDSKYRILDGNFQWVDENGREIGWYNGGETPRVTSGLFQAYDPARDVTWRVGCPVKGPAEEVRPGVVRFRHAGGGLVGMIEHNTFFRTQMVGLLVNHGDPQWFLQGPVEDFTVRDNVFIECNGGVELLPENKVVDPTMPVYRNVRIERNLFLNMPWILHAKSTRGLVFAENRIITTDANPQLATFNGCSEVEVRHNLLLNPTSKARVGITNSDKSSTDLTGQPGWTPWITG